MKTHLLIFLWFCPRACTELLVTLFDTAFLFVLILLLMAFSLFVFLRLLLTCTRDAPSKRSFRLSPTTRNVGSLIQHVFTEHEPLIPWHLQSSRISVWTCCNERKKYIKLITKFHLEEKVECNWNWRVSS